MLGRGCSQKSSGSGSGPGHRSVPTVGLHDHPKRLTTSSVPGRTRRREGGVNEKRRGLGQQSSVGSFCACSGVTGHVRRNFLIQSVINSSRPCTRRSRPVRRRTVGGRGPVLPLCHCPLPHSPTTPLSKTPSPHFFHDPLPCNSHSPTSRPRLLHCRHDLCPVAEGAGTDPSQNHL